MSEFYDNLPADFEDLEKYAPTLAKLDRRDGFVVPGDYFDALPAHIQSLLTIAGAAKGKAAGLHLPENYFDELPELLRALIVLHEASKNKTAGLSEPSENYFEELGGQLERLNVLSQLLKKDRPEIPENYFEQLGSELSTMLALDNLKQDKESMFAVPEGYFDALVSKVQARLALEQMKDGNDADVPPGYFDDFAARVQARIRGEEKAGDGKKEDREEAKVISISAHFRRNARVYAAAASLALVLGIGWVLYNNLGETNKTPEIVKENGTTTQPNVIPAPGDTRPPAPSPENFVQQPKNVQKNENSVKDTTPLAPGNNFVQQPKDSTGNKINNEEPKFASNEMPDVLEGELRDAAINYLAENEDDLGFLMDEIGLKP